MWCISLACCRLCFSICGYFNSSHIGQLAVCELLKLAYVKYYMIACVFCKKKACWFTLPADYLLFTYCNSVQLQQVHTMSKVFDFEASSPALQEYHHLDPAVPTENPNLEHLSGTFFRVLERTLHKVYCPFKVANIFMYRLNVTQCQ